MHHQREEPRPMPDASNRHDISFKLFLDALLAGDRPACSSIAWAYLDSGEPIISLYEHIITRSLYEVGRLWEFNRISVATEHMATAIAEAIMNELYPRVVQTTHIGRAMVAACVESEEHQVGIKMVADIFEMRGWDAYFLGANIPTGELMSFIRTRRPSLVALSLAIYFNVPLLAHMVAALRSAFPEISVLVGGQAFSHGPDVILRALGEVKHLPNLYSIEEYITHEWRE